MKHIRYFKTFEGCGSSGSGDIAVKQITKGKKRKMGTPSQVSDLRFLKKTRETKKVIESSQYNNDSITREEFFSLLNSKEIFGKNEVDKLTKPINAGTTFHLGLVPAINIKRFFSGNEGSIVYDVNKIWKGQGNVNMETSRLLLPYLRRNKIVANRTIHEM